MKDGGGLFSLLPSQWKQFIIIPPPPGSTHVLPVGVWGAVGQRTTLGVTRGGANQADAKGRLSEGGILDAARKDVVGVSSDPSESGSFQHPFVVCGFTGNLKTPEDHDAAATDNGAAHEDKPLIAVLWGPQVGDELGGGYYYAPADQLRPYSSKLGTVGHTENATKEK